MPRLRERRRRRQCRVRARAAAYGSLLASGRRVLLEKLWMRTAKLIGTAGATETFVDCMECMRSQPFASQASNRDFVYSGSRAITRTSVRTPASGSRTFGPLYHGMGPGGEGWGPAFPVLDCVKYVFWMFNAKTGTIVVKAKAMRANPRRSRSKKPAEHTNPDPVSGNRGRHLRTPPTQPGGSAAGAGLRRTPHPGRHRREAA